MLSCKANARVKLAKTGHGRHFSTLIVICVVRLLFVLFYVLFVCKCVLPPGDNPIAVNKYIISYYGNKMGETDWIQLAKDGDKLRKILNMVMSIQVIMIF